MAKRKFRPMPAFTARDIERYWSHVDRKGPDDCWLWTASLAHGYGQFTFDSGSGWGCMLAHRVAYFIEFGMDPEHRMVCHTCDNPPCQNPAHYFLGDWRSNAWDALAKGRLRIGDNHPMHLHPEYCPHGDKHRSRTHPETIRRGETSPAAKLKECDVVKIRKLYATETWTYAELAADFGVSVSSIYLICQRKRWSHVLDKDGQAAAYEQRTAELRSAGFSV
jgi:hypothetical protein